MALQHEGIEVKGRVIDTMVVGALLDENRWCLYINALGRDYLNQRKNEKDLQEASLSFGVDAKSEMYKLPAHGFVGAYAEQDASLTLNLWNHFKGLIVKEDIADIFDLETKVIQVVFAMRKQGVRVDLEKAERVKKDLLERENKLLKTIKDATNCDVEIWCADSVLKRLMLLV